MEIELEPIHKRPLGLWIILSMSVFSIIAGMYEIFFENIKDVVFSAFIYLLSVFVIVGLWLKVELARKVFFVFLGLGFISEIIALSLTLSKSTPEYDMRFYILSSVATLIYIVWCFFYLRTVKFLRYYFSEKLERENT